MSDLTKSDRTSPGHAGNNTAVRTRLIVLRIGVAVGFVIVLAVSSFYGRRNERMLELVQSGYFPSVQAGGELRMLLTQMQRYLQDAAQSSDTLTLDDADLTYSTFTRTLKRAQENPVGDQKGLEELRLAVEQYYSLARRTTERMIEGETFDSIGPALALMKSRQNAAETLLAKSSRRDEASIRSAFVASRNIQRTTVTVMGVVILACMAALFIGSLLSDRLYQTRRRNDALQRYRAELEEEVGRRTQELTAATEALVVARDAAERAADENAELSRRNRMVLDAAGEGIFGLDGCGMMTFINPAAAAMLGWQVDEILGRKLHDVIQCGRTPDATDHSCFLCSSGGNALNSVSEIATFNKRDGSSIPVEYTASSIVGDDGLVTGRVVTFRDISVRRAVEQMKEEFVSTVNHELRTPLTSIRGALGLLNSGRIGPVGERGQRMLSIAVENTDRLIRLINDILDVERINAGKFDLDFASVVASDLMRTAVDGVQALADQAKVELQIEPAHTMIWVDCDRIVQTLTNLVSNAIKFSPAGTTVSIGGTFSADVFTFHVSDRGRGIPQDRLESVFERFKQIDASDSRDKGGSGLGLAICRSIVNAHGGRIWAERRDGGGSRFLFTVQPAPSVQNAGPAAQRTVLICGGGISWRTQMAGMLETSEFRVVAVPSAGDIAAVAATTRPDAIVLDVVSGDGWRTAEALHADAATRSIPVVVIGMQQPDSIEGYAACIAGWVAQPTRREELVEAVTMACVAPAILLVEDDLDLARVMTASLEIHGIRTLHAATGQDALALCRGHAPSLIVLDMVLPDIDGFAVVEALRNEITLRTIPLVVYSALDVRKADHPRLTLGRTEYLTKSRTSLHEFQSHVIRLLGEVTTHSRQDPRAA